MEFLNSSLSAFLALCCVKYFFLKAYYVKKIDTITPRVHDLYKLALKSNLEMTEEQMDALLYVTLFNIDSGVHLRQTFVSVTRCS